MDINDILHTHHDDISNQLGHYTTAAATTILLLLLLLLLLYYSFTKNDGVIPYIGGLIGIITIITQWIKVNIIMQVCTTDITHVYLYACNVISSTHKYGIYYSKAIMCAIM